jgi:ABC-type nitrate/sulfonate/bicarbonate transport system substrate-binding protein
VTTSPPPGSAGPLERRDLTLGFVPLTDCAPLVVAQEKGFFAREGLNVQLSRQASWANIRDKVLVGSLDGAQMLAPMPLAATLRTSPLDRDLLTGFVFGLNGNAVTVSNALYDQMTTFDPHAMANRSTTGKALRTLVDMRAGSGVKGSGANKLTFAVVYPQSPHAYELRYWMAAAGIDPDRDVRLTMVPPPQMAAYLLSGEIDGYCVGEPWNSLAVHLGIGRTLLTSQDIWSNRAEKVLGVSRSWAEQHPSTHRAVIRALLSAAAWLDLAENREEAALLITQPGFLDVSPAVASCSLLGRYRPALGATPWLLPDFHVFHRHAANYPWRSQAIWYLTQMVRWGHADPGIDMDDVAARVFRPDLYAEAAADLGIACPTIDRKTEGGHPGPWTLEQASVPLAMGRDTFLDGSRFDPDQARAYVDSFPIHHRRESSRASV